MSFSFFGVGGLFLSLIIFPMINLFVTDTKKKIRLSRKIIHRSFKIFIRMMSVFGMFDFDIFKDCEQLELVKGKIIIANHPSLIDVVVLLSLIPHADCIVKQSLWSNPFLRGVVAAAGYIRNTQDTKMLLEQCQRSLDAGYVLVIFPEGTRTVESKAFRLQRGASNIAIRCNKNILPVTIKCEPTTLTKQESWYQIPDVKPNFFLRVGEEIKIETFQRNEQSSSVRARHLTAFIKKIFIGEQVRYAKT